MKQLKFIAIVVILIMVTSLTLSATAQDDDPFSVAIVAPSAKNDLAFSQSIYDGLNAVQEEMGEDMFQFTFIENTFVVDDATAAIREWAASGEYDLIMAHGGQFAVIIEEVAPEFPEQAFALSADVALFDYENVYYYEGDASQGGYINGYMAAMVSDAKSLGVIGPVEIADAKLYVDGFTAGAEDYAEEMGEDVDISVNYIGSFSDVTLASETAEAMITNGADVLTGSSQMVVGPIALASENGEVYWFGTQGDHTEVGGDVVVMGQIYNWEVILNQIIENVKAGEGAGEAYLLTLENGGLTMEYNEAFFEAHDTDMESFVETLDMLVEGVIAGDIMTIAEEESEE